MCEYTQLYQTNYSHLPLSEAIFATCPECGKPLTIEEMWPSGHCSRSLCQRCYNQKFGHINAACAVRGCDIQHKVPLQQANLREVSNHICDSDYCRGRWAQLHTSVTGFSRADAIRKMQDRMGGHVNKVEPVHVQPVRREPIPVQPIYDDSDVHDAEWEEMIQETLRLAGIEPRQVEHPKVNMIEHNPRPTAEDELNQRNYPKQKESVWIPVRRR